MTTDEADFMLLKLANEKGKFAIEVGCKMGPDLRAAFERGIDNEWFTLVDVSGVTVVPGRLMRVFRLTAAGWKYRRSLEALGFGVDQNDAATK